MPEAQPDGVVPDQLRTPQEFSDALARLRTDRGISIRALSSRTGIPTGTLGGYFTGRHLPPPTQPEIVAALLVGLGVPESQHRRWRDALARVRRAARSRTAGENPYRGLERYEVEDSAFFFGREHLTREGVSAVRSARSARVRWVTLVGASGSGKSSLLRAGILAQLRAANAEVDVVLPRALTADHLDRLASGDGPRILGIDQFEEFFAPGFDKRLRLELFERLRALVTGDSGTAVIVAVRADHYGHCIEDPVLVGLFVGPHVLVGAMNEADLAEAVVQPARECGRDVEPELVELVLRDAAAGGSGPAASVLPLVSHAMQATWDHTDGPLTAGHYVAAGSLGGAITSTAERVWDSLDERDRERARVLFSRLVSIDDDGRATRRRWPIADLDELAEVADAFSSARILTTSGDAVEVTHEVVFDAWPRLRAWVDEGTETLRLLHRVGSRYDAWVAAGRHEADLLRGPLLDVAADALEPDAPIALPGSQRDYVRHSLEARAAERHAEETSRRRLHTAFVGVCILALAAGSLAVFLARSVNTSQAERRAAVTAESSALSRQVALESTDLRTASPVVSRELALAAYRIRRTAEARSALLDTSAEPTTTRLLGPSGSMRAVYSPDGGLIATAGGDGKVHLFLRDPAHPLAVPRRGPVLTPAAKSGLLFAADFSPDGRLLAVGGVGGIVTVYDVSDPTRPAVWSQPLTGPTSAIQGLRFNHDGTELAAATSDPAVFRWRIGSGHASPLPTLTGFDGSVQSVAFGPHGLIAAGSTDAHVRIWREGGGRRGARLVGSAVVGDSDDSVYSVDFSPDGSRLAAGTKHRTVDVWRVRGGRLSSRRSLGGFAAQINSVAFSPSGDLLAAVASGGSGMVWRTSDDSTLLRLSGSTNFTSVAFSPDQTAVMTGGIDGTTDIMQLDSPALRAAGGTVWGLAYADRGARLLAGTGTGVVAFDTRHPLAPRRTAQRYRLPHGLLGDGPVAVSPDGRTVALGTTTGAVGLFHASTGAGTAAYQVLGDPSALVENLTFGSNGELAVASDDDRVYVYALDGAGRAHLVRAVDVGGLALGVAFSPDASVLAVATANDSVELLSTATGAKIAVLRGFRNYVYGVTFSPDGKLLAAGGSDAHVRLWNVADPRHPREIGRAAGGPTNGIFAVQFSPDGHLLAAAASDDDTWLWRVGPGGLHRFASLDLGSEVTNVAFDPRGSVMAAAGGEGLTALWSVSPAQVAAQVCRTAGSPLTRQEWHQYVPGRPYERLCR